VKTPPDSWADLFDPERLKKCKNRVSMLDDMREVIGAALIYLGHSPNTTNALHLQAAEKVLREQKKYLAKYDSESFKDSLASGEILLAQGWSGELAAAQADNPDLGFAVPKEGALMFVDNWCIPKGAPNKRLAEEFINFMLRPKISARNVQAVMYASTNEAAEKLIDPKILDGPAYCMPKDLKVWTLETPGDALDYYEHVWTNLRAE
jgi:spermidine/putrescine transport system substrate-binding protein